jgi:RimJ/RimL family protein N-acetyltransferase
MAYELHPEFWGRGIATRLCHSLTAWGHESAGLIEIRAATLISNARSARVLERCEYYKRGTLDRFRSVRGVPSDYYLYSHERLS